ncbi:uncharacterized protein LOC122849354 [Aphidius gifuensis]|uniref:uncharacterized protein LOC122849354 n=1 Tax=Aphidius gifuensis TaxID=684658 RepID=UPI001CDBFB92|nr:uncharacterized protein LOC122849354 [Aphidius gifuensis]
MTKKERQERMKINDKCGGQIMTLLDSTGLSYYEKLSIFNRFRWYVVVIISGFIVMGVVGFTVHHRHNLNVILSSVGIGLSFFCVTLKGACFKWYRKNLITINNILSKMMEDQMTAKDDAWEILIEPMSYFAKTAYPIITCLGFSMFFLLWSRPTLAMIISYREGDMKFARFYPTYYMWTVTPGSWTWILNIVCKLFGEFVGPFVLVIVLSTAMDQITFSKISWPLVYTLYKLLQIFIYSWGGELIKTESEEFRDAVYFSAWTDAKNNKLVSHSVRMMMHQRPIIIKACQIKPITAELFSGLINTTLSYFFLLQTINEKS